GDVGALVSALASAAAAADPDRAASLAPRRAALVDVTVNSKGRARILEEALDGVPGDPASLALLLAEELPPGGASAALWRAGVAAAEASAAPIARFYRLAAGASAAQAGDGEAARARASELMAALPADRLARRALLRSAARIDPSRRAQAIVQAAASAPLDAADAGPALAIAEAPGDVGDE